MQAVGDNFRDHYFASVLFGDCCQSLILLLLQKHAYLTAM